MTQVPGWTKLSLNCIVWHSTCNKTDCASICTCNNASKATLGSISIFQYTHFQHPLTRALQLLYEHRRAFFLFSKHQFGSHAACLRLHVTQQTTIQIVFMKGAYTIATNPLQNAAGYLRDGVVKGNISMTSMVSCGKSFLSLCLLPRVLFLSPHWLKQFGIRIRNCSAFSGGL
ncbi:hypothetical protein IscW_ISCW000693 [Ixodes scapularis]|uniref:Uncharacterized protein n=1 Tax=Ixodes scapularis TaxID=6945 RepID=B7P390_IXOSC|nr:hypothetical protein IscW_ISCW000693 [Ixodes scapularis]|eukprot:XP_002403706.1 hypothetical protein IscW_ISCW000693 [Ixodes scapularis]